MKLAGLMREQHERLIEDNPIDVLIYREERVESGGGFNQVKKFVGLVHGRLYQETTGRSGKAAIEVTTPGLMLRNERWGLVAPTEMTSVDPVTGAVLGGSGKIPIDLRDGPHVKDQFETPMGHFEITKVWPRQDGGETWGYVCELEEIE